MADNRGKVTICGTEYEVESSIGATIVYKNEFKGKLDRPYIGNMTDDILTLYGEVESDTRTDTYFGFDIEAVFRIAWAMAVAAGSTNDSWQEFFGRLVHEEVSLVDVAGAYNTCVRDLGERTFFRLSGRLPDDIEPDEEQEAEYLAAASRGRGMARGGSGDDAHVVRLLLSGRIPHVPT